MDLVDKLVPEDWYAPQRAAIRDAIDRKTNYYDMIMKIYQLDPGVRESFFRNFITNASLKGSARQFEDRGQIQLQRAVGDPDGPDLRM
jgi:hypothetical protein